MQSGPGMLVSRGGVEDVATKRAHSRLPQSDRMLQGGKSAWQCLKKGNCEALESSFFEYKRSMLDARSRSGGRKGHLVLLR